MADAPNVTRQTRLPILPYSTFTLDQKITFTCGVRKYTRLYRSKQIWSWAGNKELQSDLRFSLDLKQLQPSFDVLEWNERWQTENIFHASFAYVLTSIPWVQTSIIWIPLFALNIGARGTNFGFENIFHLRLDGEILEDNLSDPSQLQQKQEKYAHLTAQALNTSNMNMSNTGLAMLSVTVICYFPSRIANIKMTALSVIIADTVTKKIDEHKNILPPIVQLWHGIAYLR